MLYYPTVSRPDELEARARALRRAIAAMDANRETSDRVRFAVREAVNLGVEKTTLAQELGVHRSTIYEWLKEPT